MPKPSPPTNKMTEKQKEAMQTRKAVKEGSLSNKELKKLVLYTLTSESKGQTKKRKSRKSKKSRKPRKSKRTNRRSKKR